MCNKLEELERLNELDLFYVLKENDPGKNHLRLKSNEVGDYIIGTDCFNTFLRHMTSTMINLSGVGLAAPQVGLNLRFFITSINEGCVRYFKSCTYDPLTVWINPSYEVLDNTVNTAIEGCLSIPNKVGLVSRPSIIKVEATNQCGSKFSRVLSGYNARAFLHEYDHLEGILYTDHIISEGMIFDSEKFHKIKDEHRSSILRSNEWLDLYGYNE